MDSTKKSIKRHIFRFLSNRDIEDFRFEIFDKARDDKLVLVLEFHDFEEISEEFMKGIDTEGLSGKEKCNLLRLIDIMEKERRSEFR